MNTFWFWILRSAVTLLEPLMGAQDALVLVRKPFRILLSITVSPLPTEPVEILQSA
jgi:hypothetical protein